MDEPMDTVPLQIQPLSCDPTKLTGLSERLIVSHHENNYGGAVKRLNAIEARWAALEVAAAPTFVVNGLKREELIAANSMVLLASDVANRASRCPSAAQTPQDQPQSARYVPCR